MSASFRDVKLFSAFMLEFAQVRDEHNGERKATIRQPRHTQ